MCAPPDLERNTIALIFFSCNFLTKPWWTTGYISISIQPHFNLLSLLIGIIPRPGSLPSK